MKLQLPNGKRVDLPKHEQLKDIMNVVDKLLVEFDDILLDNPSSPKVVYFLNGLSNYIVWFKEVDMKNKQDKEILSRDKTSRLNKYDEHNIPFSSLSPDEASRYGILERDADL